MIRKSGYRFSEKIMLKSEFALQPPPRPRSFHVASNSSACLRLNRSRRTGRETSAVRDRVKCAPLFSTVNSSLSASARKCRSRSLVGEGFTERDGTFLPSSCAGNGGAGRIVPVQKLGITLCIAAQGVSLSRHGARRFAGSFERLARHA